MRSLLLVIPSFVLIVCSCSLASSSKDGADEATDTSDTSSVDTADSGGSELVDDSACSGEEVCDGIDNDCDGFVDNVMQAVFFLDFDSDTYGDGAHALVGWSCAEPNGYVGNDDDCDDSDPTVYPGHGC